VPIAAGAGDWSRADRETHREAERCAFIAHRLRTERWQDIARLARELEARRRLSSREVARIVDPPGPQACTLCVCQ
jgi:hypothetical protein